MVVVELHIKCLIIFGQSPTRPQLNMCGPLPIGIRKQRSGFACNAVYDR